MESTSIKAEKRFLTEFDDLKEVETPNGSYTYISKLKHLLTSKGFKLTDPRIKDIAVIIDALESRGEDIDFDMFKELIRPCYTFFRTILQNQLTISNTKEYYRKVDKLFQKLKSQD